ncbi:hypothetical protein ScPMuIL_006646 [Solemya velum]
MGKKKFKKKPGATLDDRRKVLREARRELAKEATGKKTTPKYTVDQLLDKVEEYTDRFEYELAQKFCQRALEVEPDNLRVLETTGTLLLELGNTEGAKQCFGRAVEVCPESGHSKYMYLGQLFEGSQAVDCFQKGIELMMKEKVAQQAKEVAAASGGKDESTVTDREISSAHCSIAELYMTDCCFDEEAEAKCKGHVEKAIAIDTQNPEAYQLMASFLLTKEDKEGAREMIDKSVSLWLPKAKELDGNRDQNRDEDQDPNKGEDEDFDPVETIPLDYDTRLTTAKLLIEVENYETCVDILEGLLDENDEDPQVYYLMGWSNFLQGQGFQGNARFYLKKAQKIYTKVKYEDPDLLKHVEQLLLELGTDDENVEDDEDEEEEECEQAELEIESDSDSDDMQQ